jgi:hypothetical protein
MVMVKIPRLVFLLLIVKINITNVIDIKLLDGWLSHPDQDK